MNYVKVVDGKVVEGPSILTSDPSASPNSLWGAEQLRDCGYVLVDVACGPDEVLGEATVNPDGSVTFARTPKTPEQLQDEARARFDWKLFTGTVLNAVGLVRADGLKGEMALLHELIDHPNWEGVKAYFGYLLAKQVLSEAEKNILLGAFNDQGITL